VTPAAEENTFNDVAEDSPFHDAVEWAVELGITSGDGDSFAPETACTQDEIVTFLYRAYNGSAATGSAADIVKAAQWATELNLSTDRTKNGVECTREQVIMFLWELAGSPEFAANNQFSDVPAGTDYAQAVAWAVAQGITQGTGDGSTFSPDAACTRGQIMTFLYRALGTEA
jgi:hypothetical protein